MLNIGLGVVIAVIALTFLWLGNWVDASICAADAAILFTFERYARHRWPKP